MSYIFIYYPLIWIVVNVQPRVVIFCADNNYVPKLRDHNFNTLRWKNVRIFAMMTSANAVPIKFKETMINLLDINVILEYKKGASIKWYLLWKVRCICKINYILVLPLLCIQCVYKWNKQKISLGTHVYA